MDVPVRSPSTAQLESQVAEAGLPVPDHSTNAWFRLATGVIAWLTVVALIVVSPRCTLTPQVYSTTYHCTLIAGGVAVLVARSNSSVCEPVNRPRSTWSPGTVAVLVTLKIRYAFDRSTALMVT